MGKLAAQGMGHDCFGQFSGLDQGGNIDAGLYA